MNVHIRVTGPAGLGINSSAEMILNTSAKLGYDILTDIEYESRIKGGVNYYDIFIHDSGRWISKFVDIIIAFDHKSVDKVILGLKKNGIIIINSKYISKFSEVTQGIISEKNIKILDLEIAEKYDNTYLIGILGKLLDIPQHILFEEIADTFGKKGDDLVKKNQEIVSHIMETYIIDFKYDLHLHKIGEPKKTMFGNQALSYGAIEGGLEFYAAYPMTPASTILTEIIVSKKVTYLQAEDEIAVINAALGASFTGARSMVGSSGGGFALMSEALSFAVQAEFPIVAILSQRAGPSTGTPTYFEQGDLNFALHPTFADFDHIVLCPSSLEESYYHGGLGLNLADKYQSIVITLIDKQFSEAFTTINTPLLVPEINRGIILDNPPEDYARYEFNTSGISPRVHVGTKNGDFIATSYEHDEFGATTEDSNMKIKMTEKRAKKLENFYKKENIQGFHSYNSYAEKIIITTSLTSLTVQEFIKNNPKFGLIVITILKPLDERLLDEIKNTKEVIFVESNYSGQLENYITKEFGLKYKEGLKISHLRKYDLFPFYYEDFETLKN